MTYALAPERLVRSSLNDAPRAAAAADDALATIRAEIDAVDAALAPLLARRLLLARAAASAKLVAGRDNVDAVREAAVLTRALADGRRAVARLDDVALAEDLRAVYWTLFDRAALAGRAVRRAAARDAVPAPRGVREGA